jgi:hypothetical protein
MTHFNGPSDPRLQAIAEAERAKYRNAKSKLIKPDWKTPDPEYVRERLSLAFWETRELPPVDPLLGELLTTTSRIMLAGPTGLGKTSISMAMGIASSDGADFLHWRGSGSPRRILYIDGEMSRRLFKDRLADAVRRHGNRPETFFPFSREDFEDMPPLDTTEGQEYVDHIIEIVGGVDATILDNIQALTMGELREPESWRKILPWTRDLTRRCIGQIWEHHTTRDADHAYGDSTREWGLDTLALMEPVERPATDIAFQLKFPKARERTPDNRTDFDPAVITLTNNRWESERGSVPRATKATDLALDILKDEIARGNGTIPPATERISPFLTCITVGAWRKAYELRSVSENPEAAERAFYRAAKKLTDNKLIAKHNLWVWPVR